jgi:hypothetical protein
VFELEYAANGIGAHGTLSNHVEIIEGHDHWTERRG